MSTEVIHNIIIKFGVTMETVRIVKICVNETFFFFEKPNLFAICNNTFSKWWEG
jgi:hypothetical protein